MAEAKAPKAAKPAKATNTDAPIVSVVVPVHNESGAIEILVNEIEAALNGFSFEIIVVDDASTDDTLERLTALLANVPLLRLLAHKGNAGQSRAIISGMRAARGRLIATLDGDGQNDPKDLPSMIATMEAGFEGQPIGLVAGERVKRQDTIAKKWASKVANFVRQGLLADDAKDSGCGIKVVRTDVFRNLPAFDHMHRYMPALVKRAGEKVVFVPVSHRPRGAGQSKYTNIGRLIAALTDLFGVIWLGTRARNPGIVREIGPENGAKK